MIWTHSFVTFTSGYSQVSRAHYSACCYVFYKHGYIAVNKASCIRSCMLYSHWEMYTQSCWWTVLSLLEVELSYTSFEINLIQDLCWLRGSILSSSIKGLMTVVPSKWVFRDHDNVYINLVVCVIYSLCNTSLKVATNGDRNMQEVYND